MKKHSSIVGGIILILVGLFFLGVQFFPSLLSFFDFALYWPLILVGMGGLFLIAALAGTPPLVVPGSIISGLGLMMFWQNATGNWDSWAYSWALIPGFVGVGLLLLSMLDRSSGVSSREGRKLIMISLIMFVIGFIFFNGLSLLGNFWPVLLILGGFVLLWRNRRHSGNKVAAEK